MLVEKSTLVFGGAASGKSAYAEKLVRVYPGTVFYIATAQALDNEMSEKIAYHRRRRGDSWITIEEPYDLPSRHYQIWCNRCCVDGRLPHPLA